MIFTNLNSRIIVISLILLISGCTKDFKEEELKHDHVKISGIYQSSIMNFGYGSSIQYSFSFKETNNENIIGGVRIIVIGAGIQTYKRINKAKFNIDQVEETADGNTLITGNCDFGNVDPNDFGKLNFTGTIYGDTVFEFRTSSYLLHDVGKAYYSGNYIQNLDTNELKYQGIHNVKFSNSESQYPSFCYPPNNCDSFELTMNIVSINTDGIGGLNIIGNFDGHIPPFFTNDETNFNSDSDIFGENLYIGTYGWKFSIRGNNWEPTKVGNGVYRIEFFDDCYDKIILKGSDTIFPQNKKDNEK
jgi:hypothetical protein